ncbi:MAG: chromosomal replication initiator protein DnaA [Opitutales bacterium]
MESSLSQNTLWDTVKSDFQHLFPHDVYKTWFEPMCCLLEDDEKVVLGVPSDFAAIWIQDNYFDFITGRLQEAAGRSIGVSFEVSENARRDKVGEVASPAPADAAPVPERNGTSAPPARKSEEAPRTSPYIINPRNTFDNFIVGPGNQLAHAASIAVASAPARAYNPLFLYGETGLGKTHLMHAVALHILREKPEANVAYISTEKFMNEFIKAITENTVAKFRKRYRGVDVLLIDDIHFLSGKERIQEEFFHTFNDLFESQKQIFLSSDRPASEIAKLESRLVSRFQWGLVTDIQPPDLETRVAILEKKAAGLNLHLKPDLIEWLAAKVSRNVRRMEGALTRVAGYVALMKGQVDVGTLEKLLQDILQEEAHNQVTVEKIQKKVAEYFDLRLADMVSKRRPANIAFPRQIAMYLSRMLTNHSLQEIGDGFGGRDHGTVIHACKTVENVMEQDPSVKRSVEYLENHLASQR